MHNMSTGEELKVKRLETDNKREFAMGVMTNAKVENWKMLIALALGK